jgi:prepilin peptidase CpaA
VTSGGEKAVQTTALVFAIAILAIIAYGDMHTRRIPNALAVAIAVLGLVRMILVHDLVAAGHTLAAAAAVFAIVFLLFSRGIVGGGDAKLLAAMALLIGYQDLFGFLFLMSICGGALALAILARDKFRSRFWILSRPVRGPSATQAVGCIAAPARSTVPYGVAIAVAGVIMLILETSSVR